MKEILQHRLGICKHKCYVYRSNPEPFIIIFPDVATRDLVLQVGSVIDGPIELRFHAWEIGRFGDRTNIPFNVRLSIEGIPQHAWFEEIAEKALCDEAIIHHVEEASRRRIDQRVYVCWTFTLYPGSLKLCTSR